MQTSEFTRTASAMSILDAFDRRLDRDEAMIIFNNAIELNERMRESEMVARTIWDVTNGKYKLDPPEAIEVYQIVLKARLELAEKARVTLLASMKKVEQCPRAEDTIN